MPQISTQEFERLALRVHDFLAGVPLHNVWAIYRGGAPASPWMSFCKQQACVCSHSCRSVRALVSIPLFIGRLLGWDREPAETRKKSIVRAIGGGFP
jgi:hypothetical protein